MIYLVNFIRKYKLGQFSIVLFDIDLKSMTYGVYCIVMNVHASVVLIDRLGILLRGFSGAGKSTLALDLITHHATNGGFARLVGDDRVDLHIYNGKVIAKAVPCLAGLIERRGYGLCSLAYEAMAVVHLVVELIPETQMQRMPDRAWAQMTKQSEALPLISVPCRSAQALPIVNAVLDEILIGS